MSLTEKTHARLVSFSMNYSAVGYEFNINESIIYFEMSLNRNMHKTRLSTDWLIKMCDQSLTGT